MRWTSTRRNTGKGRKLDNKIEKKKVLTYLCVWSVSSGQNRRMLLQMSRTPICWSWQDIRRISIHHLTPLYPCHLRSVWRVTNYIHFWLGPMHVSTEILFSFVDRGDESRFSWCLVTISILVSKHRTHTSKHRQTCSLDVEGAFKSKKLAGKNQFQRSGVKIN